MPGRHNALNAVAAVALASSRGVPPAQAARSLASFPGVRRRQEIRGVIDGVTVIDDFAHHPTAVRETLLALDQRYRQRLGVLWAIFEPRTATSCRRHFQEEYARAFDAADRILVAANARASTLAATDRFDPELLAARLRARGGTALHVPEIPAITRLVASEARPGDVVVILSNGGFGGLHGQLLAALADRAPPRRRTAVAT
jgi:UDP-N-acetylmuramate: L-alanyl-gamma-D-glutamyl-meso-diaminopimelate ligase